MGFQKIIPYKNPWDGAVGSVGTSRSNDILILIAVSWYLLDIYDIAWLKRTILSLIDPLFHWSVDFVCYSNNEAGDETVTEAK